VRIRIALAIASSALLVTPAGAADDDTRATMNEIYEAIRFLLPLSLSDEAFGDPSQRDAILRALTTLAKDGAHLESHGRSREASFTFLSASLARDTADARARFALGRVSESRYLLHRLTDNCVECHSRLPSNRDFPKGREFVESEKIASLPPDQRVILEVATRQFEQALESYEELFASPDVFPAELDLMGHFDSYLEVALRIRTDPARPARVLERFAKRSDVPAHLRSNLDTWVRSLRALEAHSDKQGIARARTLLAQAEDRKRYKDARAGLVDYIAASSLLHRYLVEAPRSKSELAEAYYLLGVAESRVGRTFWLSQTEFYLETCIRLEPGGARAEAAFDLLEEFVISGYTGSAGSDVPTDVRERLLELRQLIDAS
jgi:hypothetical protein